MGKVLIIIVLLITAIFAAITLSVQHRAEKAPEMLSRGNIYDLNNVGAYALRHAIKQIKAGSITSDITTSFDDFIVLTDGRINSIKYDFEYDYNADYPEAIDIIANVSWITPDDTLHHECEAVVNITDTSIPGQVGYWDMDDGSGYTARDSSDNKNDGTLIYMDPSSDWSDGNVGGALDFDGDNDYVGLGTDVNDTYDDVVTVVAWLKADNPTGWLDTDLGRIVGEHTSDNWLSWTLRGRTTDGGYWHWVNDPPSWKWWTGHWEYKDILLLKYAFKVKYSTGWLSLFDYDEVSITMDELAHPEYDVYAWHYVVGVYDGTYSETKARITIKIVDEDLENSKIIDKWTLRADDNFVTIGGTENWFGARCWNGLIDEVRILNKVLTDEEIEAIYTFTGGTGSGNREYKTLYWRE